MLTNVRSTAIGWGLCLALAVFFSAVPAPVAAGDHPLYDIENNLNDLIYQLSRSVVTIEASRRVPAGSLGSPGDEALESIVSSGIVCDSMGRVLASAPAVVGRDRILVNFDNRIVQASIMAVDYQMELALLDCRHNDACPADFSTRQACAGQMVVGLGNAYGVRAAPTLGFCAGVRDDGMMQFTVPTTSGSIGGGVFDLSGKLLGIITNGLGAESRVTVAVPAYQIPGIVKHLLHVGDRQSGFVGITSREIEVHPGIEVSYPNSLAASSRGVNGVVERGVLVTSVIPQSPAHRAGLRVGDLIYLFNGIPINSAAGFARLVRMSQPGSAADIHLLRQTTPHVASVTIGQKQLGESGSTGSGNQDQDLDLKQRIDAMRVVLEEMQAELTRLERQLREGR
ncbi:PDZ domain-containing protein [candidate division GN15 bacterium]|nr:PDZ domain-containing protein [candidate division GN15 bacterium]